MYLTGLDRVLRDAGVPFKTQSGWKQRTAHAGGLRTVKGVVWHTTVILDAISSDQARRYRELVKVIGHVASGKGYIKN